MSPPNDDMALAINLTKLQHVQYTNLFSFVLHHPKPTYFFMFIRSVKRSCAQQVTEEKRALLKSPYMVPQS